MPQELETAGLNSLVKTVYLHAASAFLVNGLPEGQVIASALLKTVIDLVEYLEPQVLDTVYLIVAVPAATPVINPDVALTVAIAVFRLLQVPPLVPLLVIVVVDPTQIEGAQDNVPGLAEDDVTVTVKLQVLVLPQ